MVVKTDLCVFSEWKIYPGRGIRYVAKDGRPFLFLSKRTRNFGLKYAHPHPGSSRPSASDGPPPGAGSIKNSSSPTPTKSKRRRSSRRSAPSRASLSTTSAR